MITLIKKDIRVFRVPIIALKLLIVMTLTLPPALTWYFAQGSSNRTMSEPNYGDVLQACAGIGLFILIIMAAAFGASAFAVERRERWLEFLAMIPVKRREQIVSKLLVCVPLILATFIFWHIVSYVAMVWLGRGNNDWLLNGRNQFVSTTFACATIMSFSLAWAISTFSRSAAIAAGVSIGLVGMVYIYTMDIFHDSSTQRELMNRLLCANVVAVVVGAAALVISSIFYCRRVQP